MHDSSIIDLHCHSTASDGTYAPKEVAALAQKTGLPAYSLAEAKKRVLAGAEVIYLGWIMAGSVKGYAEAAKRYQVRAVCGVGMGRPERKRTACGKSRRFQPAFRCSPCKGTLMSKSCTASTAL